MASLTASHCLIEYITYTLYIYKVAHVIVGVGNDLFQLSGLLGFEGPETLGNLVLNVTPQF
jgi:hypothetical protein